MRLDSILTPARTQVDVPGSSQKRVLEHLSQHIAENIPANISADAIFNAIMAREKLGSTGIGQGIAIPHCRIEQVDQAYASFFRLQQAIDFDAIDDQPVDLFFVLLVPPEACDEHLQTLATLAGVFSQADVCQRLRDSANSGDLYDTIIAACA